MQTRLASACEAVLETAWLFVLILTPLFFNVFSARSFEPDKTVILRSIALFMCAAWLIKWIEEYPRKGIGNMTLKGLGTCDQHNVLHSIIDTPCVLPAILFFSSYAFSTIISIYPRISFFGSYSRLQGLYTFIAYGIIFFALVSNVKKREQVERIARIIIFTSIPVSVYGILQHYGLDTIVWSTTIGERITGANMGNPIFVSAYLIMVIPVTISMLINNIIENRNDKNKALFLGVANLAYATILTLQFACILFTQSRGPWLGLLTAFFVFFLGTLILLAQKETSRPSISFKDALYAFLFAVGGILAGFLPAYFYCFIKRKGWRWLWLGFIFQTIIVIAFIISLNIPNTPLKAIQKVPYVSRLGDLSYRSESGTSRVRVLIWDGTIDLIRSNPIRMIVGYGPESMKHVWDLHSPAELGLHESKNAAPDRSHNETFDRIVTTGIIGFLFYMFLVGSIFFFGLKFMGLITSRPQKVLFSFLTIFGSVCGILISRIITGTFSLTGIGLSFGYVTAISIYIIVAPFMTKTGECANQIQVWKTFLILGLLSGIVAHFIEIHFGIAIASTRLYFFAFSALILALGTNVAKQVQPVNEPTIATMETSEKQRKKSITRKVPKKHLIKQTKKDIIQKPISKYLPIRSLMVYTLLTGLIISTTVFSFVTFQPSETDAFGIVWLSLIGQRQTFGTLILLIVVFISGGFLVFTHLWHISHKSGKKIDMLGAIGIYTATIFIIFLISSFIQTTYLRSSVDVGGIITFFFVFIFVLGLATSFFLMLPLKTLPLIVWKTKNALWVYVPLVFVIFWITLATNINSIKADIYLKLGLAQERASRWSEGIRLVTRAIDIDPNEETFYLNLGRILFGKANSVNDVNEKNTIFEKIRVAMERAHSLNPLNTDHIANLGLLYFRWAEFDSSPEGRQQKLITSSTYFQKALEKSPRKIVILNNSARVFAAQGNLNRAIDTLNRSLTLDKSFAGTYVAMGDIYSLHGKPKEALQAYEKAIELDKSNADALSMAGLMYFKEGRLKEALEVTQKAIGLKPDLMKAQSLLGLIYYKLGRFQEAIDANLKVLSMRPADIGAHRNLVILYEKISRRDKAINHLEAAIQYSSPQERKQLEQLLQYMKGGKPHALLGS